MSSVFRKFWERYKEREGETNSALVYLLSGLIIIINLLKSFIPTLLPAIDPNVFSIALIALALVMVVRVLITTRSEEVKSIAQEILHELKPHEEKEAIIWNSVIEAGPKLREWIVDKNYTQIKIDLFSYSCETFQQHLINIFKEICSQPSLPVLSSITLRILTRNCFKKYIIPCAEDNKSNRLWKKIIQKRSETIQTTLTSDIEDTLKKTLSKTTIKLIIKVCPFEPLFKGIIVNETNGLFGFYPIEKVNKTIVSERISIWDYIGFKTKMVEISKDSPNLVSREIFVFFEKWFNFVWDNCSDFAYPKQPESPSLFPKDTSTEKS